MYTNRLDNIFESFFGDTFFKRPYGRRAQRVPEVNVFQTANGYELEMKTPGLEKGDVDIAVEDNTLRITSNYSESEGFKREFELPEDSDQAQISAELKDGIIHILIPKVPTPEPRKIELRSA